MDEILQMERTMHVEDANAKGMAASGDEHFDLTPELDLFQYRMIKPYVRMFWRLVRDQAELPGS